MNRVFLVMVVSALLVTFGLAQTPDAGSNTDPANVKGCLGGSDGNYTVVEDGTRQTFKITTSSVDLKPHLGHDVKLIGHKAGATASPGAADNSFAVTELSMISEHCAAAAALHRLRQSFRLRRLSSHPIPPQLRLHAAPSALPAPARLRRRYRTCRDCQRARGGPAAPAATVLPLSRSPARPPWNAVAPAATVAPPAAAPATPAVEAAAAATATVEPSPATPAPAVEAAAPVANDARPARLSAHARKLAAAKAAAATESAEPVAPTPEPAAAPAAEAATPAATAPPVSPSAETVTTPDATAPDAAVPAPAATHRTGSLALLIGFVVVVIVLGTTAPLIGRWRKRKALERDGSPNLSFTHDSSMNDDQ